MGKMRGVMASKKACKPTTENRNSICPYDLNELSRTEIIRARIGNTLVSVPVLSCATCDRKYTSIKSVKDLAVVRVHEDRLINLNLPNGRIRKKLEDLEFKSKPAKIETKTIAATTYGTHISKENAKGYVTFRSIGEESLCLDPKCRGMLKRVAVYALNGKNKPVNIKAKKCQDCGKYCVPIKEFSANTHMMECINEDEIIKRGREMLFARGGEDYLSMAGRLYESHASQVFFYCHVILANEKYLLQIAEKNKEEFKKIEKRANGFRSDHKENEIKAKDFLIKRNVFKCVHDNHVLEDVNAIVSVITNEGNIEPVYVLSGYCRSCNVYFVLEDSLKELLSKGRPMCFLYDWDRKEKELRPGYIFMSAESLLYQYGYNVNAIDNIPAAKRQRILEMMIDGGVITKNEILSYLNLFITQRKNNKSMQKAIGKWKEDIDHILQYKADEGSNVQIQSLHNKA